MERNQQLLERMHQINNNFSTKTNRYSTATADNLENKLELLKKKLHLTINKNKDDLNEILADANELYEKAEKSNKNYENQANAQMERLAELETKMTKKIQLEILERKERENAILSEFQERAQSLRRQIEKQRKTRQNLFAQMTNTLESDIPAIMAQLNEAKLSYEGQEETVSFGCLELVQESEKYLKQFTTEQEANSNKAFELIRDLTKKIKAEIDQEKYACEATHEQVFAYVEQACNNIVEDF